MACVCVCVCSRGQRLAHLFENVNFLEFVKLLSHFSDRCPRKEKLRFIFQVCSSLKTLSRRIGRRLAEQRTLTTTGPDACRCMTWTATTSSHSTTSST